MAAHNFLYVFLQVVPSSFIKLFSYRKSELFLLKAVEHESCYLKKEIPKKESHQEDVNFLPPKLKRSEQRITLMLGVSKEI